MMKTPLIANETDRMVFAVFFLRIFMVLLVLFTLSIRGTLPPWMLEYFRIIAYPLLIYCSVLLIFYKKTAVFLNRHPFVLYVDLFISVSIILIGGSWRSSYFGYTVTSIVLFTIFKERKGAYISAFILALAALIKDPSGKLSCLEVFFVTNWDMRIGASLMYIFSGVILGYFSVLLQRLEKLSKARAEEAQKLAVIEERSQLALELHDSAKQIIVAMLLKMNPLVQQATSSQSKIADDLFWLYRGMNYLQEELSMVMNTLKGVTPDSQSTCNINEIVKKEAKIVTDLTGMSWNITQMRSHEMNIRLESKQPLRRFVSEALMNIYKHSGEKAGAIKIECTKDTVSLCINDKGDGFTLPHDLKEKTLGLKSLQCRAEKLNGNLTIETEPNKGCKLTLLLPKDKCPHANISK